MVAIAFINALPLIAPANHTTKGAGAVYAGSSCHDPVYNKIVPISKFPKPVRSWYQAEALSGRLSCKKF